ncbi:hypothetical protein Acr_00g0057420 [Actinidia rufa]|uniref:Uncharacterized protein n=1 Tax=Actinidia rufa TaxID=165716 RepID=A0A7J0DP16_9ERIC|nr:hypothetical protein Acr_00g0057420 [Actinidia rufa]
MSKRISFKKLDQNMEKSKADNLTAKPIPAKGVVIAEKHLREEFASSPNRKGKVTNSSKGKEAVTQLEAKKKMAVTKSRNVASLKATLVRKHGEGPLVSPDASLGPKASFLARSSIAKKILSGALVLESFLVVQGREGLMESALQQGRAASLRARCRASRVKRERDALSDMLKKSAVLVGELRDMVARSKELAVEEFKSSSECDVAVENVALKYFSEGFDFWKRQLRRHYPDLAIDLEGMGFDHDILAEEDENEDEESGGEKEK